MTQDEIDILETKSRCTRLRDRYRNLVTEVDPCQGLLGYTVRVRARDAVMQLSVEVSGQDLPKTIDKAYSFFEGGYVTYTPIAAINHWLDSDLT
jgi:hypothetical protein